MNPKSFLLILIVALALFGITFIVQCTSVAKDSVIVKQNDKELLVRKYQVSLSPTKDLKSFEYKIDSSLWRYPPNKILYDGKLIKAKHDPNEVVLRISKQEVKNGVAYKVTTNKDVSEYFSCNQVEEFENNIGKRMIITKVFFPRERIFYKFP
jgi:uncharacterized lipoprotein YehR (DUF1307 family)